MLQDVLVLEITSRSWSGFSIHSTTGEEISIRNCVINADFKYHYKRNDALTSMSFYDRPSYVCLILLFFITKKTFSETSTCERLFIE